jgi:hypothetical protein
LPRLYLKSGLIGVKVGSYKFASTGDQRHNSIAVGAIALIIQS